ncbi:oca3 [Candida oxycetoniae]|uniref:ER membrane protein complex subunit 2 n=1 Tax=Candida oxycetoniae TaxID=497107 RepID=A0AAI9WX07_9ASCO|nr:oca3 [Candida oxycetoniae]KAI3403563.1 oca3 [Candida oxycetoniae]
MFQTDHSLVKRKLLQLAATGRFSSFTPKQLYTTFKQLSSYLSQYEDKLDLIELFQLFELKFYLSILTNHDIEAKNILDRLSDQFGHDVNSQRIRILQSIYYEAQGQLKKAGDLLSENPDELQLSRRLTTFARYDPTAEKYIKNLNFYLNLQPADVLTWCELSEEYRKLGLYDKAIYCLNNVIIVEPTAYPIFYKIGLLNYYHFLQLEQESKEDNIKKGKLIELMNVLILARDNYLYSLEINDKYDKSWVGLWSIVNAGFAFNKKLKKVSESSKAIKEYLNQADQLKTIVEKKLKQLDIEIESRVGAKG